MLNWIKNLILKYDIDGLRIDTIPYVPKWFWKEFSTQAGVYQVGEVFNGDVNFVAGYQGSIDALLNYPLYFQLKNTLLYGQSMNDIESSFFINELNN